MNRENIKFYIPKNETIPTALRLYVDDNFITYERVNKGFIFKTLIDDENEAVKVVKKVVNQMIYEHDETEHGIRWATISLKVVPQEERYKVGTNIEWIYRVRDSY